MRDQKYTLLDAIREEKDFLLEMEKYYTKHENSFSARLCRDISESHYRILQRFENGREYYLGVKNGETKIMNRQTTKHLEREYPAVAKAKAALNTVVSLTQGGDDV